jgi:hypothetical protein
VHGSARSGDLTLTALNHPNAVACKTCATFSLKIDEVGVLPDDAGVGTGCERVRAQEESQEDGTDDSECRGDLVGDEDEEENAWDENESISEEHTEPVWTNLRRGR